MVRQVLVRPLLVSAAAHGAGLALLLLASRAEREAQRSTAPPIAPATLITVSVAPRPRLRPVRQAPPGRAAPGEPLALAETPAPAPRALEDTTAGQPADIVAPAPPQDPDPEPGVTAADKIGGGTGGDGDGATGRGFGGDGDEPGRRGPRELFARVTGGGVPSGQPAHDDRPYLSLEQATALRQRDYFPRLPASLWPTRQPYVVVVDLCVSEQGLVVDAVLQSSASPRLDPVVMAAVRTWRYQPLVVDGAARAFCHEITIEYALP